MSKEESNRVYYTIGEVAEMFNVNPSLIRYWEKEFDILKPYKNKKGNRLFKQEDIEIIRIIYNLVKERGYTLQGAKEKLLKSREETINNIEMLKTLQKVKAFLLDIKTNL